MEEEKFYVDIKDDFGKVRTFEVPTLEMKLAIDNIDEEIKQGYKQDALRYSRPFSAFKNMNYIEHHALKKEDNEFSQRFMQDRFKVQKCVRKVIRNWDNEKYKKIIYMFFFNGLKRNKIADILGCKKQTIGENFKVALEDFAVMLSHNERFQKTDYYQHLYKKGIIEVKLTAIEKLRNFSNTKNLKELVPIDKMIALSDTLKIEQKKEKKTDVNKTPKKTLENIKFKLFGEEYSLQDMIDTVNEFLAPFRKDA